jgi:hypothetical protein
LLPQVILEMSLSQKLSCLIPGVQSSTVTVINLRHRNLLFTSGAIAERERIQALLADAHKLLQELK